MGRQGGAPHPHGINVGGVKCSLSDRDVKYRPRTSGKYHHEPFNRSVSWCGSGFRVAQVFVASDVTPTTAFRLNMVERLFAEITRNRIRRRAFKSAAELKATTMKHLENHNANP